MKSEEYETIDSDKLIQIKKYSVAICSAVENNSIETRGRFCSMINELVITDI